MNGKSQAEAVNILRSTRGLVTLLVQREDVMQSPRTPAVEVSLEILSVVINIYILFAGREVRIEKNCARGLEYGPRPQAEGRAQVRGHSFSQYGPTKADK